MAEKIKFNVLEYDWHGRKATTYDVLPYFRNTWNGKFNFDKKNVVDKKTLQEWIESTSRYMFWARCQYEFLMAPWPYKEDTLIKDMYKIDVHEQIMNNIDVITNILYEEFKIEKKKKPKEKKEKTTK